MSVTEAVLVAGMAVAAVGAWMSPRSKVRQLQEIETIEEDTPTEKHTVIRLSNSPGNGKKSPKQNRSPIATRKSPGNKSTSPISDVTSTFTPPPHVEAPPADVGVDGEGAIYERRRDHSPFRSPNKSPASAQVIQELDKDDVRVTLSFEKTAPEIMQIEEEEPKQPIASPPKTVTIQEQPTVQTYTRPGNITPAQARGRRSASTSPTLRSQQSPEKRFKWPVYPIDRPYPTDEEQEPQRKKAKSTHTPPSSPPVTIAHLTPEVRVVRMDVPERVPVVVNSEKRVFYYQKVTKDGREETIMDEVQREGHAELNDEEVFPPPEKPLPPKLHVKPFEYFENVQDFWLYKLEDPETPYPGGVPRKRKRESSEKAPNHQRGE